MAENENILKTDESNNNNNLQTESNNNIPSNNISHHKESMDKSNNNNNPDENNLTIENPHNETIEDFNPEKYENEIKIIKKQIESNRKDNLNKLKQLNEEIIKNGYLLKEVTQKNQKFKNNLEDLNNKVNILVSKRLKIEATNKDKKANNKKIEKKDYQTELKIKENEIRNAQNLINNLTKSNINLKKILDKYSSSKTEYLNKILKDKTKENLDLQNKLKKINEIEKSHLNCVKEIDAYQKEIFSLKNEIKISNQKNIREQNKLNLLQNHLINSKIATKKLSENLTTRKKKIFFSPRKEQEKSFEILSRKNNSEDDNFERLFTDQEIDKISNLFTNGYDFDLFLRKLSTLERYKHSFEKNKENLLKNQENSINENYEKIFYFDKLIDKNDKKILLLQNTLNDTKNSKNAISEKINSMNLKIEEKNNENYEIEKENICLKNVINNYKDLFSDNKFDLNENPNIIKMIERIKQEEEFGIQIRPDENSDNKKFNNLEFDNSLLHDNNENFGIIKNNQ